MTITALRLAPYRRHRRSPRVLPILLISAHQWQRFAGQSTTFGSFAAADGLLQQSW